MKNLLAVKNNIVVVYDPVDEIISLHGSSYTGMLYLFADIYQELKEGKKIIQKKNDSTSLFELLKITESDFSRPEKLYLEIQPMIPVDNLKKLHLTLERLFNFVRVVDVNSRMEESITIRRSVSGKQNVKDLASEVANILKNAQKSEISFDYNDKEGRMMRAFNQENTGLSEIIIKFVKFMHRFEVCSLSIFDIYSQKPNDVKLLKLFLWNLYFMDLTSKINPHFNNKSKFDEQAIRQGSLNSHREF